MSARVRAQQFPGIMEARGEEMWCNPCGQRIDHKEKSTASKHVKYSAEHQRQVERMGKGITKPGTSANVLSSATGKDDSTTVPATAPAIAPASSTKETLPAAQKTQVDLKALLDGIGKNQAAADDFAAAFMQAGIPPLKLQHPAIKGLMWKYTKVHGCIRNKDEVYKASRRAGLLHKGAIRHKIKNQKYWVGTDEWTDEQGHAIANVLIGVGPKVYVVATLQLQCKGPNQGVEHTELGAEVLNTLSDMGVKLPHVIGFVSIERSFSLDGLVDVKNRQSMGKDLREACVTMFCNGDVEERFAKWQ